ncbi:TetR/AcrR family transcriptional regulator [Anaerovorax odorimutans]|uniref:TetR/AcrR family transcriptional regulator n=1 Tax=Anaerovorax odorimutans TaxID=109327 RepID=UPI000401BB47|nr:TetR/AcrR family transcriptional regulator [Anaerovorax odorimutans]
MDSQKVVITKNKIKNAFFQIYEDKKLEKISIKEITDLANLNRGTFYVYYKDIYDLLEKIENEYFEEIKKRADFIISALISGDEIKIPDFKFLQKNKKYIKILLGKSGSLMNYKIKTLAKNILKEKVSYTDKDKGTKLDYVLEYIASAQIGLIIYWIQNDLEFPIEDLILLVRKVSLNGPITYVKQLN